MRYLFSLLFLIAVVAGCASTQRLFYAPPTEPITVQDTESNVGAGGRGMMPHPYVSQAVIRYHEQALAATGAGGQLDELARNMLRAQGLDEHRPEGLTLRELTSDEWTKPPKAVGTWKPNTAYLALDAANMMGKLSTFYVEVSADDGAYIWCP